MIDQKPIHDFIARCKTHVTKHLEYITSGSGPTASSGRHLLAVSVCLKRDALAITMAESLIKKLNNESDQRSDLIKLVQFSRDEKLCTELVNIIDQIIQNEYAEQEA